MHRRLRHTALAIIAITPTAISACVEDETEALETRDNEVLAEFSLEDGTRVTFEKVDSPETGDFAVAIGYAGPNDGLAYDKLFSGYTPLEIFLETAPAGTPTPEDLVVNHEAIVLLEGREDDTPLAIRYDRIAASIQNNSTICDSWSNFVTDIDYKWILVPYRVQARSTYGGTHAVQKSGNRGGYLSACNHDGTDSYSKPISMCAKAHSSFIWSCHNDDVDEGDRHYYEYYPTGETEFDFKVTMTDPGTSPVSFIGVVTTSWY